MLPLRFKPLSLIALLLLAAGLLGCAADTTPAAEPDLPDVTPTAAVGVAPVAPVPQLELPVVAPTATLSVATPTPTAIPTPAHSVIPTAVLPTSTPQPEPPAQCLPHGKGTERYIDCLIDLYLKYPIAKYPNLTAELDWLVQAVEDGSYPTPLVIVAAVTADLRRATQDVTLCLKTEPDAIVDWLESRNRPILHSSTVVDDSYAGIVRALVPVSMLGELSRQEGVSVVKRESCFGPDGHSGRPGDPFARIPLGASETFILLTNAPVPPGVWVGVNYPEGGGDARKVGNLAIGDCPGGQNEGLVLSNGSYLTLNACSPGIVSVRMYQGDKLRSWVELAVIE